MGIKRLKSPKIERDISSLPDELLNHILSFLPTKYAVATSVLSRRWRLLWTYVRSLNFDDGYFDSNSCSTDARGFSNFVTRVLLRSKANTINSFRLTLQGPCSKRPVNKWITTAIARRVETVDLFLHRHVRVPPTLFKCETLVNLRLSFCVLPRVSRGGICAPCLKKLHLSYVTCQDYVSLPQLVSGCVALEELAIRGITCRDDDGDLVDCEISSRTLTSLLLDITFSCYPNTGVKLDTPALECLKLGYDRVHCVSVQALSTHFEAEIFLRPEMSNEKIIDVRDLFPLLEGLSNVKSLIVDGMVTLLISGLSPFPMRFNSLTKLDVTADWRILIRLLQCADLLETLIMREAGDFLQGWVKPEHVPVCLSRCIRAMSIHVFRCQDFEFNMVRYILRNAKVLKLLNISFASHVSFGDKSNAYRKISTFKSRCEACEISYS